MIPNNPLFGKIETEAIISHALKKVIKIYPALEKINLIDLSTSFIDGSIANKKTDGKAHQFLN